MNSTDSYHKSCIEEMHEYMGNSGAVGSLLSILSGKFDIVDESEVQYLWDLAMKWHDSSDRTE